MKLRSLKIFQNIFLLGLASSFVLGCVSYQAKVKKGRNSLATGQIEAAAIAFEGLASKEGRSQVVHLLDYGMALHLGGRYKESNMALLKAESLADRKDYISVSKEAGSILTSERLVQYKSDRHEFLLINVYLALNFLLMKDYESALVECRKIDLKLEKYRLDKEPEAKNFFARYLSALIWEAKGEWSSAFIDYKNAYRSDPHYLYLREDLIRSAYRSGRKEDLRRLLKRWPDMELSRIKRKVHSQRGELVVLFQQGWVPRKRMRPRDQRFPYLRNVRSKFNQAQVKVDGRIFHKTKVFYDIGTQAKDVLNRQYGKLVAKRAAGVASRVALSKAIDRKEEGYGELVRLMLRISDKADLRQWSTLPETLQMVRVSLGAGTHEVEIEAISQKTGHLHSLWQGTIEIRPGQKVFLTERTF